MRQVFKLIPIERNLTIATMSAVLLGCMLAACASSDPAQDGEQEVDEAESAEALKSSPDSPRYICANNGGGPFTSKKAAIAHCGSATFVIVKTLKECRQSVCGDCRTDREACLRCGRCEADR
jgi:hypothetical protein